MPTIENDTAVIPFPANQEAAPAALFQFAIISEIISSPE